MKMINLGNKQNSSYPTAIEKKSNQVSYPSFSINNIELPISSKDVGKTMTVTMSVKVLRAGHEIEEYGDKKKRFRATFSMLGISFPGKKDLNDMTEAELDDMEKSEFDALSLFAPKKGKK